MEQQKTKNQKKWQKEISNLEAHIPILEKNLQEHRDKLKNDTSIDFYEIDRRMTAAKDLIRLIERNKKRLIDLKERV